MRAHLIKAEFLHDELNSPRQAARHSGLTEGGLNSDAEAIALTKLR
jgi:hypothetical protein